MGPRPPSARGQDLDARTREGCLPQGRPFARGAEEGMVPALVCTRAGSVRGRRRWGRGMTCGWGRGMGPRIREDTGGGVFPKVGPSRGERRGGGSRIRLHEGRLCAGHGGGRRDDMWGDGQAMREGEEGGSRTARTKRGGGRKGLAVASTVLGLHPGENVPDLRQQLVGNGRRCSEGSGDGCSFGAAL